jgi:hypothetical protein
MTRPVIHEARLREQVHCRHTNCGWAVLTTSTGHGQIRWKCMECGWRDRQSAPYAEHPGHNSYPVVIPNRRRYEPGEHVNYTEYLASEEWRERADLAKARAGHRCQVCNSATALNVHHRTYERLGREWDCDLTVLCRACHELFSERGALVAWRGVRRWRHERGVEGRPCVRDRAALHGRAGEHPEADGGEVGARS